MSARQNRPEYLYFSPVRLNLAGIAGFIFVGAMSLFLVVKVWPGIGLFAQGLRTAQVAAIEPERVYALPDSAVTPSPATSSNSTYSTAANTTETKIPAVGSPSEAQAVPPIDRRLKGAAFWAAQKDRVEAMTALVHERWDRISKGR